MCIYVHVLKGSFDKYEMIEVVEMELNKSNFLQKATSLSLRYVKSPG